MSTHESFAREVHINGSSDRVFGLVMTVFFFVLAAYPLRTGGPVRTWPAVAATAFLLLSLAVPRMLRPLNRLWTRFGLLLHRITSPIVVGLLFFGVITPLGLLMQWFRDDPMRRRRDPEAASYWIVRDPPGPDGASMTNQF